MTNQPASRAKAASTASSAERETVRPVASMGAFVPIDRRDAAAAAIPARSNGAVLKADLTGFTRLTIALNEQYGPKAGAERLGSFLNELFARMIDFVHRRAGSVIQFTGDGITCWFPGESGAVSAVATALDSQRAFLAPADDDAVGLKMAVTSGHADRLALGDPSIQKLDILTGPPVFRVEQAERIAESGEVVMDWTTAGLLAGAFPMSVRIDSLEHRSSPSGEPLPFLVVPPDLDCGDPPAARQLPPVDAGDWSQWAPDFVRRRLSEAGGELFLAEYRLVSALFVRFGGIDHTSDSRALELLDAYIIWGQGVVSRYGGALCQVIIGDKGTYFYASFGAPQSHEDDPVRAVRAAEELGHPPAELSYMVEFAAGIAQGPMLCGLIGSDHRRTYGVLGESANAAARLMQRAEQGEILVEAGVAEATEGLFRYGETVLHIGPLVAVALEPGPPPTAQAPGGAAPILGRERAVSTFRTWLTSVGGRLLVYAGEPGIGKTRLMATLASEAADLGYRSLRGSAAALDAKVPFGVWRSIVAQFVDLDSGTEVEIHDRLRQLFGAERSSEDLTRLLRPVLPVADRASPPESEGSESADADAVLDAILELVERMASDRVVLFLDNAQWFDSSSIRLLGNIRDRRLDLPTVIATRSHLGSGFDPSHLAGRGAGQDQRPLLPPHVRGLVLADDLIESLEPLGDEDIVALAAQELAVEAVPDDLADLVVRRSGGNPFFAIELLHAFGQSGDVRIEDGVVHLERPISDLSRSVPVAVKARLDARLSDLPIDQQSTLKVASVLSHTFDMNMLASVHPAEITGDQLGAQLESLRNLGIIRVLNDSGGQRFSFTHDLLREAALGLQTEEVTRHIHGRAAQWMEAHASDLPGGVRILAEHWDKAGRPRPAMDAYVDSAGQALASGAYVEAVEALSRAIALASATDEPAVTPFELADWYVRRGRARVLEQAEGEREAKEDMVAALRLIGFDRPSWAPTASLVMAEYVRHRRGVKATTGDAAEEAALAASAYEQLVELSFLEANEMAGAYAVMRSLTLAEQSGDESLIARAMAGVGYVFGLLGSHQRAESYVDSAELRAAASGDDAALVYTSIVRSFYYTGVGRWDRAGHSAELALEIARRQRFRRRHEDALSHLMMQAYLRGRLDDSMQHADELAELAQRRSAQRNTAYALQGRIYAFLESGSLDEAGAALDQLAKLGYGGSESEWGASARPIRPDDEALDSEAIGMRGLVLARTNRVEEALEAAQLLVDRLGRTRPSNLSAILSYLAPLEICARLLQEKQVPALQSMQRPAEALARRYIKVFPIGRPRALYWRASIAEVHGKPVSRRLFRDSAEAAAHLGMAVDEERAWSHLIEVSSGDQLTHAQARLARLKAPSEEDPTQ